MLQFFVLHFKLNSKFPAYESAIVHPNFHVRELAKTEVYCQQFDSIFISCYILSFDIRFMIAVKYSISGLYYVFPFLQRFNIMV